MAVVSLGGEGVRLQYFQNFNISFDFHNNSLHSLSKTTPEIHTTATRCTLATWVVDNGV